jgi:hypothetical protein
LAFLTGGWLAASVGVLACAPQPAGYGVAVAYPADLGPLKEELFGTLMVGGLVLGLRAVLRRDIRTHQRWMARAYAVAQGAGTQALILGPMVLLAGQPSGALKATGMGAAWVINLAVAEWLVRRSQAGQSSRRV